ncbi:calcium-binding protein [Catellatospora sp. IY07-71]|uniref:calcium-binding protein n=1 Tax=Catellatospora sp. IY07-71 TaxID=2728827 RepID=UPI001BB2EF68|nr:calcium-binding protein [Catellatospora sp. IY07-71]
MRRWISTALAAVLALPLAAVHATPAHAAEPWETALRALATQAGDWAEQGLGQVGRLGQPIPLLGVSPGSLTDAEQLIARAADVLQDDLTNDDAPVPGGGTLDSSLSEEPNGDHTLDLTLRYHKQLTKQQFAAAGVTLADAVSVDGWATLRLKLRVDAAGTGAHLIRDAAAPRLDIDAVAHLGDTGQAKAALGILGVAVDQASTLDLSAHFVVKVNDPNGDGRLAFGSGELGAPGSLAGLVQVTFDHAGGVIGTGPDGDVTETATPGKAHAEIKLKAAPTQDAGGGAPVLNVAASVNAGITLDWPDITDGTPSVTTTGLDETLAKFRNMSLLDLGAGLAQIAELIGGIQASEHAGNRKLPFLKGTLADAVKINEQLVAFLGKYIRPKPGDANFQEGVDDPALAGQPRFTSLQDLFTKLAQEGLLDAAALPEGGATLVNDKIAFPLKFGRTSDWIPLDTGAAKVTGQGAVFSPTGFTLSADKFTEGALVGQRVVAGTSGGTITANTKNSITLDAHGWVGGQPVDTSPWVISSGEAHIGAVELGGALTKTGSNGKTGLRGANAQSSYAEVKPSYQARVTIVLDLRPSTDPQVNADRVMLRTDPAVPLFTAAFPIRTGIDFFTTAGFLKVKLGGNLEVGPATGTDMISVRFQQAADVSLADLFARLLTQHLPAQPADLLAPAVSVKATGQVKVSVPGASGSLGTGVSVDVAWTLPDAAPTVDTSSLSDLFATDFNPDDPQALMALVISALRQVNEAFLDPSAGTGPLSAKLPIIGRSAKQLLGSDESGVGKPVTYTDGTDGDKGRFQLVDAGRAAAPFGARLTGRTIVVGSHAYRISKVVDGSTLEIDGGTQTRPSDGTAYAVRPELADAVDKLLADPPSTLQDAVDRLNTVLGTGSGFGFELDTAKPNGPHLKLSWTWKRQFHTGGPLSMSWDGTRNLVSVDAQGTFGVTVKGDASIGLLLPLRADGVPLIDKSSHAAVSVAADATNVALTAKVGPLELAVGKLPSDPATVKADLGFSLGGLPADAPFKDLLGASLTRTTAGVDCGAGTSGTAICVNAPVFSTVCTPDGGTSNVLAVQLDKDLNTLGSSVPNFAGCFATFKLNPLDFTGGIDGYLSKMEEALRLASFDGKLPLVGDDLQQGQRFIADVRDKVKAKIGPALATAGDNVAVEDAVNDALEGETGFAAVKVKVDCTATSPCGPEEFKSIRIQLDASRGTVDQTNGCTGDCLEKQVPLNIGIPGLALKAGKGEDGGIKARLGWRVHLDVVLDRELGFYVATHGRDTGDDTKPELAIGASFEIGDGSSKTLNAQLAFIQVTAQKRDPASTKPLVSAYFGIDLHNGEASCWDGGCTPQAERRLAPADLADIGAHVNVQLDADVDIDWLLKAKVAGDGIGSALPGIQAVFKLKWGIGNHSGPLTATDLTIGFSDIKIDVGAFFSKILAPVLEKVKQVTGPLQPIIDTLYAPIPVLSDLSHAVDGPDITLIYLANKFSTLAGGPDLTFIDRIRDVITFVNKIPKCNSSGDGCLIPLGAFLVNPDKALSTAASPASAESLIDKGDGYDPAVAKDVKDAVDAKSDGEKLYAKPTSLAEGKSNAEKLGFAFPIFDNPASAFGLLLGQDIELVSFDSGALSLGFTWRQSFGPVYAPPPVMITLAGSASVSAHIRMGLDTKGIRTAIEAAQDGAAVDAIGILDGIYFKTTDDKGNAAPVITLKGEIAAGAQVTVLIVSAGVEGGVRLTIGFLWNDPNNDGKFRTSEFLQRLQVNPICLFTVSGQLSVFLKVYITFNLFLFSKTFDFTLVNAVLLDFKAQPDCDPPPPELGAVHGDTLIVFAGRFGKPAQRGHAVWDNKDKGDVVKVYSLHYADEELGQPVNADFDGVAVESLGRRQVFPNAGIKRVVVDGRLTGDFDAAKSGMALTFLGDGDKSKTAPDNAGTVTSQFELDAVVVGTPGPDRIKTGTGNAWVQGGGGDDIITTGDVAAKDGRPMTVSWVAGGPGKDVITTGEGDDIVSGDGDLDISARPGEVKVTTPQGEVDLSGVVDWDPAKLHQPPVSATLGEATDADHIAVGHGANKVYGNDGDDVIGVNIDDKHGNGINTLVGGQGSDTISGGKGDDKINTYSTAVPDTVDDDGYGPSIDVDKVDTGGGTDTVVGSQGVDLVTSHSPNDTTAKISGYGNADVLIGGYGTDEIYGGPGDDWVIAEPSRVETAASPKDDGFGTARTVTHEPLPSGVTSQTKLLVGGLGRDHILGGDGGSTIFGDKHLPDELCVDSYSSGAQPSAEDQGSKDLILGGSGVEVVSAGGGDDRTDLGGGDDRACGQRGDDVLYLGGGADRAWGGLGGDQVFGDAADDTIFGNDGDDAAYGGDGLDTIEGDNGFDRVFGGEHDDVLYGGSRTAADPDTGDQLFGEGGDDRLVGDNGTAKIGEIGPFPYDLDGTVPAAGGPDVIDAGTGDDIAYGGLAADTVFGGDGDDHLEGNNAGDTVRGGGDFDTVFGGSTQEASAGTGRPDSGDLLYGDGGADLILGDNAQVFADGTPTRVTQGRDFPARRVVLLDLGFTPVAGSSGNDFIDGGLEGDVAYGQAGADRILGGSGQDYAEGGPGTDWIEGDGGDDDLVGGSSTEDTTGKGQPDHADAIWGGPGSDVAIGDNGVVLRPLGGEQPTAATVRLGTGGQPIAARTVTMYDLAAPADATRSGGDRISGGHGVDVAYGQDGDDALSGDGDGDYLEGNGGSDTLRGDLPLTGTGHTPVTPLTDPGWPGSASGPGDLIGTGTPDGQDDLIGGSSRQGFRDAGDFVQGDGGADVILGDDGSLLRTLINGGTGERVYTERYPTGAVPVDATVARTHDPALPGPSTRFCTTAQATCEPAGSFGADQLWGDAGQDGIWGQDGDDTIRGGDGDDDVFGELGADTLYGEAGDDAVLGDRGGVVNQHLNPDDVAALGFTATLSGTPQETYTGFRAGYYDRRADLLHDTDGDTWIGGSTSTAMPWDGYQYGGDDRIRGGTGADDLHGGFGDDLVNGDSGGDSVYGGAGADVLWGGKGCDPVLDAATADCLKAGVFDAAARGDRDRFVDHVFGGAGAVSGPSIAGDLGSDLLDFRPRGTYPSCTTNPWPQTTGSVTLDPCAWFEMTDMADGSSADNQHHQGTDWLYGGWDRDVLQGNVAQNGPNPGDRLLDWNGAYNLYTHCNAAYGGYNDVRQHSPGMQTFLQKVVWGAGAGRSATDATTPGTSAYLELALTYPGENSHGSGSAYPATPGHFDDPTSCTD